MSDLDFTVNANTGRAQQNLQNLERNVGGVGSAFIKLKGAIAGLAAGAAIRNLFQMANVLADLSAATNVSIQSISGLGEALAQNSGNFNQANNAILRFTETLGQAFEGGAKTQEAFAKVGVTLQDLRSLSEQDLLRKTILGLGQVTDTGTRAALTTELFGRTLRGVDLAGVARDLDKITSEQREFANAAEQAGAVNQSLQNSFRVVQQQLLIALQPLAELARSLTENTDRVRDFVTIALEILKFAAIGAVIIPLAKAIFAIGAGAFAAVKGITALGLGVSGLFRVLRNSTLRKDLLDNLKMIPGVGNRVNAVFRAMSGASEFVARNVGKLTASLGGAVGAFRGFNKVAEEAPFRAMDKEIDDISRQFDELKAKAEERRRVEVAVNQALVRQQRVLENTVISYARGNELNQRRLRQEIELIGLTDQQTTMKQTLFDLEDNHLRELTRLQDLYNEKSASGKREDMRLLPDIVKAMDQLTVSYQQQVTDVQALTQEKLQTLEVEKQRLEIEQQQINLANFTNRSRLDTERKIRDIQADIARSTMTEIQQKYFDIANASKESARSAIAAENDRRRAINAPLLTNDEQREYYEVAARGNEQLIEQTAKHLEQSREWNTGWRQAFDEYISNATNAAQKAQSIFQKTAKGMEDSIVNFAKTGKFEFKNFVNTILEELLRIQIQRTFANILTGSRGNSSGSSGNILGFATGGIIPTNSPVLVGERGPELLVGASGNRVIPNDQLGGTQVTYNINAVDASSFKEMLARDPSFLFAVTEQGRRRAPGTRR